MGFNMEEKLNQPRLGRELVYNTGRNVNCEATEAPVTMANGDTDSLPALQPHHRQSGERLDTGSNDSNSTPVLSHILVDL